MRINLFKSFKTIDFDQVSGHARLRKNGYVGFAHRYLARRIRQESKSDDQIDILVYSKLAQLDSKLGTTASEQLAKCLQFTTRSDIIKVLIFALN